MNFSFFNTRGSCGIVRGKQMCEYLGGKLNPTNGYENDICIWIKKIPPPDYPEHSYIDVVDAPRALHYLHDKDNKIGVIAISELAKEYLSKELGRTDISVIPHHHCNYERELREDRPVRKVGIIGSQNAFQYDLTDIRKRLSGMGLELLYDQDYWAKYRYGRQAVVDFYKQIDIQLVWRPKPWSPGYDPFRNPLKVENASSFGIPTIAYPEPSYVAEWASYFLPAKDIEELLYLTKVLKDDLDLYEGMANKAVKKAEEYHISNIAKMYRQLK